MADHYLELMEEWQKKIADMDTEKIIRRFGLEADADAFYITFLAREYRIDKGDGKLTVRGDRERTIGFNEMMCIYHLFYYAKEEAFVSGRFVPFRQVKRAAPFDAAYQRTILKPLAMTFDGKPQALEKACLALGGEAIPQGDVGYRIQAFSCMPLIITFWDGDDEFEAQANMLFDSEITTWLHEETVVCVASELASRLCEEAGLKMKENLLGSTY